MTQREMTIASVLLNGERFGREIRAEYQRRSGGRLPLGSLYTTLDRMEGKGLVCSRDGAPDSERGGIRRRFYRLTSVGRKDFDAAMLVFTRAAHNA